MNRSSETKAWLILAVGALAVAGFLALLLAVSRAPGAESWFPWGPDFFRKGLVTHVVFSFQIWLLAMLGALASAVSPGGRLWRVPYGTSVAGAGLLLVPTLAGWGQASLNNYVPVLTHPTYYVGLGLFAAGVLWAALRPLSVWRNLDDIGTAVACAGLVMLAALSCIGLAAIDPALGDDQQTVNERLFWGGGHVLQFLNAILAMLGWLVASRRAFGPSGVPSWLVRAMFIILAAGAWSGPVLQATHAADDLALREAFTHLFWYVLPVPPMVVMAASLWPGIKRRSFIDPVAGRALLLSVLVFGLGGVAGFFLGQGDTRTPSHYHAMIGGVNLALMALIHLWLLPHPPSRWLSAQYWLYGGGQALHAIGFYLAGTAGVARKTAGAEQGLDSLFKLAGMATVGVGGAVAVLGGVIFVVQAIRMLGRSVPGGRT